MRKGWTLGLRLMMPFLFCHSAAAEVAVSVGTEYMQWREYHPMPLLEESGFRPFVQVEGATAWSSRSDMQFSGRLYHGDLDYNGQFMDGTPLRATTGYSGVVAEAGASYLLPVSAEDRLSLVFHGGMDAWTRELKGTSGYSEDYRLIYLRIGVQDEAAPGRWSARGGLLLPLSVRERVNLAGGFELQPKGRPSPYFDVGRRIGSAQEVGIAFRRYSFDASSPVWVDVDGGGIKEQVFQPTSEADVYSVYWRFGL